MKPKVPTVQRDVWKGLYAAAQTVNSLRPWKMLDDRDLIGVRDSASGETAYGCFMGSAGTLFGFCLYRGSEGFDFYKRLMSGIFEPESENFIYLQNCLKMELGAKSDLEKEDLAIVLDLGLNFKGKIAWPYFRSLLPGYYPWFLNEGEARLLTLGLDVACHHLHQVMTRKTQASMKEGEVLVYTAGSKGYSSAWEPWPIHRPVPPAPIELDFTRARSVLAKATKPDSPWEAGTFFIPAPITDGQRPFFTKVAVVCQSVSGFVFNMKASGPEDADSALLAEVILDSIENHGFRPSLIHFGEGITAATLSPLSKALEIPFESVASLPAVKKVKDGLIGAIRSGRLPA
jgi:hypothetical protein